MKDYSRKHNQSYGSGKKPSFEIARPCPEEANDRLIAGDFSLVNDLSVVQMGNGTEKNFFSFATKYCSHHQPKQYAIYDSYVDKILRYFRGKDRFAQFTDGDLKNYSRFNAIINQFRQYYGLQEYDLKMTDRYLWQLGKAAFPREYK